MTCLITCLSITYIINSKGKGVNKLVKTNFLFRQMTSVEGEGNRGIKYKIIKCTELMATHALENITTLKENPDF